MKACYIESYGGLNVMRIGKLPDPTPARGQVLIAIEAASVNPVDWKIRRGDFKFITGRAFPKVLGMDLAGRVVQLGPGAADVAVGDRVYGPTQIFARCHGSHAELAVVKAKALRVIPEGISAVQAAVLPGAALTAVNGLRHSVQLDGQRVIVNGATGGVGHFALQIVKTRGALVTAVCSAKSAEFARKLGADEVLDYQAGDLARAGEAYDLVFDAHGGLGFKAAAALLTGSGTYITTLARPQTYLHALWRQVMGGRQIVGARMRTRPEDYAEIEQLVSDGRVKPVIAHVYPLDETVDAFAALEQGGVKGKIVVQVR